MAIVDYVILGIIALSVALGIWRGLIKEVLSLVTWILAFWLALTLWTPLAGFLARYIDSPTARGALAFALLLVAVLVIGALFTRFASKSLAKSALDGLNRLFGGLFGLARGVAIVLALLTFGSFFSIEDARWHQGSMVARQMAPHVAWVREHLREQG
jgi:membrane protein required for colicin V production